MAKTMKEMEDNGLSLKQQQQMAANMAKGTAAGAAAIPNAYGVLGTLGTVAGGVAAANTKLPEIAGAVNAVAGANALKNTQMPENGTTNPNNKNGNNTKGVVKSNTSASATQKLDTTLPSPNLTNGSISGRPAADGYQESAEVQAAREAYQNALQGRPQYQQSPAVLNAQAALDQLQQSKPQGYESKWGPALENLLMQIQSPGKFNYEFNGDNLFKQFADMYTQQGRQASMNAMGEAAALTGGYGNSYAQMAGTQANQQYLTQLYDRGMELRDRAYQQFLDEQQNTLNQYNTLAQADEQAYGRYRDTVGDWENERGYLTDRYDTERNYDYGQYRDTVSDWQNQRDFAAGQYNSERSIDYGRYQDQRDFAEQQYQYDTEIQERVREFDESLNWDKLSAQQKYAAEYCMQILAKGQMPTDDMLKAAGLSQADAAKLKATKKSGGGTGSKKTTNTYYEGPDGKLYTFDAKGNAQTVDESQVKSTDIVDSSYANLNKSLTNGVNNIVNNVKGSETVQGVVNSVNNLKNGVSSMTDAMKKLLGL